MVLIDLAQHRVASYLRFVKNAIPAKHSKVRHVYKVMIALF